MKIGNNHSVYNRLGELILVVVLCFQHSFLERKRAGGIVMVDAGKRWVYFFGLSYTGGRDAYFKVASLPKIFWLSIETIHAS